MQVVSTNLSKKIIAMVHKFKERSKLGENHVLVLQYIAKIPTSTNLTIVTKSQIKACCDLSKLGQSLHYFEQGKNMREN
jgi:hypothetical protein